MPFSSAESAHLDIQLIKKILEQASDGVIITEAVPFSQPGPKILYVNKAYVDMTGYTEQEVVGKTPRILQGVKTDKEELGRIRACLENGVSYKGELINYRKNREEFWTSIHISPILDIDGGIRLWIGIKRDISRMKENEERLRAYGEEMEEMVQARTIALADAHNKLSEQYDELQSSIDYAKRVQDAVLTSDIILKAVCPSSFAFMCPKDKVSGDFLFAAKVGTKKVVAVVDSTGHGVPGALLSLVGHQLLNRIVNEQHHVSPASILRRLQLGLKQLLSQGEGEQDIQDGMDVALVCFDTENKRLTYAGANRPLFVANDEGVQQVPGSKKGIGGFLHPTFDATFKEVELAVNEDEMIYLTSDGYYDQIGGPDNKRMKRSGFMSFLSEVWKLDEREQQNRVAKHFDDWLNGNEQLDDVAVVGIRM